MSDDAVAAVAEGPIGGQFVETIRKKVLHVLGVYPRISPSMLQVGIGPTVAPQFWRPVVDAMIAAGEIHRWSESHIAPSGRSQSYSIMSLTPKPVEEPLIPDPEDPASEE